MHDSLRNQMSALTRLCDRFRVKRLGVFGSAATDSFRSGTSDFDFVVEFEHLDPVAHADAYFGLLEALEDLFGTSVDLVELNAVTNPYFKQSLHNTKVELYVAA